MCGGFGMAALLALLFKRGHLCRVSQPPRGRPAKKIHPKKDKHHQKQTGNKTSPKTYILEQNKTLDVKGEYGSIDLQLPKGLNIDSVEI